MQKVTCVLHWINFVNAGRALRDIVTESKTDNMPKTKPFESVLRPWVEGLTFQMQALLLTAMRGPDENNKFNAAKALIRYLRGVVIKPAGDWKMENDNDFMWGDYDQFGKYVDEFFQDHDEYPHHFIMHLVHCAEVIGYKHTDNTIRTYWIHVYFLACDAFHMNPEPEEQMDERLNDFGSGYKDSE